MNETAGQSLVESLNKEHGPDRALFLLCNVESEEEIKGNMHTQENESVWLLEQLSAAGAPDHVDAANKADQIPEVVVVGMLL